MIKVLVLGIGGAASKALARCLALNSNDIEVTGADCNEYNIRFSEVTSYLISSASKEKEYIKSVNNIIKMENIDFVMPQHDKEVYTIGKHRNKINAKTFLPSQKTIELCQDKQKLFEKIPNLCAKLKEQNQFPYWIRATKGAGGKGSFLVENKKELYSWKNLNPAINEWQVCEYLPGRNVGIDVIWINNKILDIHAKERIRYFSGKSMSGITGSADVVKVIPIEEVRNIVNEALLKVANDVNGIYSIDLKQDKNNIFKITEINPGRFLTSSLVLFHLTEYNMPLKLLSILYPKKVKYNGLLHSSIGSIGLRQTDSLPRLI